MYGLDTLVDKSVPLAKMSASVHWDQRVLDTLLAPTLVHTVYVRNAHNCSCSECGLNLLLVYIIHLHT